MRRLLLGVGQALAVAVQGGALHARKAFYNEYFMPFSAASIFPGPVRKIFPGLETLKKTFGGTYTYTTGQKILTIELVPGFYIKCYGTRNGRTITIQPQYTREAWITAATSKYALQGSLCQLYGNGLIDYYQLFSEPADHRMETYGFKLNIPLLNMTHYIGTTFRQGEAAEKLCEGIPMVRSVARNYSDLSLPEGKLHLLSNGQLGHIKFLESA